MKFLKWFVVGAFALGLIVAAGVYFYLRSQKPVYSGTVTLNNLRGKVEIHFDSFGIPHIYGGSEADVFLALGYIHAQERLFQMELIRRVSSGRLSEIFGSATLDVDKFFRMLGLYKHASWSASEFEKQKGQPFYENALAYLDGINQYLDKGKSPLEFSLLSIPKERYGVQDLFLIVNYMSFNFQLAFRTDPLATKIKRRLGDRYLADLNMGNLPGTLQIPSTKDSSLTKPLLSCSFIDVMEALPVQPWAGSNSWAIAPSKSASGKALFENDTHIGFQQPSVWYEAYLECPGYSFYGNFLAGFPYAPLGHSPRHVWGLTILGNDDLDFFEEKTDDLHPGQYFYKGEWKQMEVRSETIRVKDSSDYQLRIRSTVHGPVCNDVIHDFAATTKSPVAAAWTLLQFPSNLCEATYKLSKAGSMEEFRAGVSMIAAPGLSVVYADNDDNIAWWSAAKFVKRPPHVNPLLLLDGSSGNDDWLGFYDFSENPRSENPPGGYVYSCNNQPDTMAGILYPGYYAPEDRALRVTAYLNQDKKFSLQEMQQLSYDVVSVVAQDLAHFIARGLNRETTSASDLHRQAAQFLAEWNGSHQIHDIAPTIFYRLEYQILFNAMKDELGEKDFYQFQSTHLEKCSLVPLLTNDSVPWYDDITTQDTVETRSVIFNRAFFQTVEALQKQLGSDMQKWTWGRVHLLEHVHPIGRKAPFNNFFNVGPFPMPGANETVNQQSFDLNPSGVFKVKHGPAVRRTLDFADPLHAASILPTGISGNVMSSHYDDQALLFNRNQTRTEWMDRKEVERNSKDRLVLQPQTN